ncbi:MAG: hypothetical protein MJB14_23275 [Spirochaetes bacterium]|nr:hypothetical protein [Spirochaetota bacterium]
MISTDEVHIQLQKMAQGKKFIGISAEQLAVKPGIKISEEAMQKKLNHLVLTKRAVKIGHKYFPIGWHPAFTDHENKITSFITPCFQSGKPLSIQKIHQEYFFFNEESLQRLLIKLQFQKKIIQLADASYLATEIFEKIKIYVENQKRFTLKELVDNFSLPRETCHLILKILAAQKKVVFQKDYWQWNQI